MKKKVIVTALIALVMIAAALALAFVLINGFEERTPITARPMPNEVTQAALSVDNAEAQKTSDGFVYVALLVMSIATLLSVSVSFYLYKWRRILLAKPHLLLPEDSAKRLITVSKDMAELETSVSRNTAELATTVGKKMEELETSVYSNIKDIATKTSESSEKIDNMTETYLSLQNTLDKKDSEISRLKKGYDAEIFRKYLSRFIRIEQMIDEYIQDNEGYPKILEDLKRMFEDAFDECGVESFTPKIGDDYRNAGGGIADLPKEVKTKNQEKDFMVAEIIESGYKLRNDNNDEIIMPSKVSIYRYEKKEEV